jgi:two-component system chemotaxis response regulator CheY
VRLLIAHGSQAAQEALADVLRQGLGEPLAIVTASEGSEALELLLQDDPPEVALVDWDLPAIEGPEMCRLVRDFHHGRDTWLVVLAASRHTDTADAWRAGAAACISTPAAPSALRACVEEGLRKMRVPRSRDATVCDEIAGDAGPSSEDAGALLSAVGPTADDEGPDFYDAGPATLDAVRMPEGADDFYGFAGSELRASAEPDGSHAPATAAGRPEPDEPRGVALLQAVLSER